MFDSNFSPLPRKYRREMVFFFSLVCLPILSFRFFCCYSKEQLSLADKTNLTFHQKWHTTPQILSMGLTVLKILFCNILTVLLLGIATTRLLQGNNLISLSVLCQLLNIGLLLDIISLHSLPLFSG